MKELSLNLLDIAENSVKAGATLTRLLIAETEQTLTMTVADDGCGMSEETLKTVTDPFFTTRTTRNVGLGIPLLKMEAEQTGGSFSISSRQGEDHGTVTQAVFYKNHIDYTPLGDVVSSVTTLIQGHPDTDFYFEHTRGDKQVILDTRSMRQMLDGIPLNTYEVIAWAEEYLHEQYEQF